jgi:ABC-type transport system involved in cytochrome bd biosynthesis fused ATPase/permease subunit
MNIQQRHQVSSSHSANSRKHFLRCTATEPHDLQSHPTISHNHVNIVSGYDSVVTQELRVKLGQAQREVLRGVNLKIKRGHLHMLLGPNGCGKSTLLKLLGGLIPQYVGMVAMDQPSGFVFQNPDHQVVMPTVAADVAFGLGR